MILQQLYKDAAAILEESIPPVMYKPDAVRWVIPLTSEGKLVGENWIQLGDAKRGVPHLIPYPGTRSGTRIVSSLIVDYPAYVLGVGEDKERAPLKHAAYRELLKECAEATNNQSVKAIDRFLDDWHESPQSLPEKLLSQDRIMFDVQGVFPTESEDVRAFWASRSTGDENCPRGQCLITGVIGPILSSLPGTIKGLPNGQMGGTALITSNANAFESYGHKQAENSPVSLDGAERFTKALNKLIGTERSNIKIGGLVYVFWTKSGPFDISDLFGAKPDAKKVKYLIDSVRSGKYLGKDAVGAEDFYALALSANAARAVVRDWLHTTVPRVNTRIAQWFESQEIVDPYGEESRFFGLFPLAASLYRAGKDIKVHVLRDLMQMALHGGKPPYSLLSLAVLRIRAEQEITHARAAMIKTILVLTHEESMREVYSKSMSKLNPEHPSPAYHCGRLLAELDVIQRAALGKINTTLVDRYYGAASTTPGLIFGILLTNASKAHLPKIRKTKPGTYNALERRLEEILAPLKNGFPPTLTLQDQALFSLGFYLQRAEDRFQMSAAIEARKQGKATEEQNAQAELPLDEVVSTKHEENE